MTDEALGFLGFLGFLEAAWITPPVWERIPFLGFLGFLEGWGS